MAVVKRSSKTGYFNSFGYSDAVSQLGNYFYKHDFINGASDYVIGSLPGWELACSADVNNDGISDIILNGNNMTVAWVMSDYGPIDWVTFAFNDNTRTAVAGLSRNNGYSDAVLLVDSTLNYAAAAFADGSSVYLTSWDSSFSFVTTCDLNGDGNTDIMLKNTDGLLAVAYLDANFTVTSWGYPGYLPAGYEFYATVAGAVNDNIILRESATGNLILWGIQNGAAVSWQSFEADDDFIFSLPKKNPIVLADGLGYNTVGAFKIGNNAVYTWLDAGEEVVAAGDFTATGHESLLVQNNQTGVITVVAGSERRALGAVGAYKAVAAADYNGDGRDDIVLFNEYNHESVVWVMGEYGTADWISIDWDPNRKIVGFGNADNYSGEEAYLVDETSHYVAISGITGEQTYVGGYDGTSYRVIGVGDFNNDKISDIAFLSNSGSVVVWVMNSYRQVAGYMSIDIQDKSKYICGVLDSSNGADLLVFDVTDGGYGRAQLDHGYFTTVADSYDWNDATYLKLTDTVAANFGYGAGLVSLNLDTNEIVFQQGDVNSTVGYLYANQWSLVGSDNNRLLVEYTDGSAAIFNVNDGSMAWLGCPQGFDIVGYANVGGGAEKDIILHNQATGEFSGWIMGSEGYPVDWKWITSAAGAELVGSEDFNGDGVDDLWIAFDKSIYVMDSETRGMLTATYIYDGLEFLDLADVTGDNHADLIVKYSSPESEYLSYIDIYNNGGMMAVYELDGNHYRAAADVDGDNKSELLVHNASNNGVITIDL